MGYLRSGCLGAVQAQPCRNLRRAVQTGPSPSRASTSASAPSRVLCTLIAATPSLTLGALFELNTVRSDCPSTVTAWVATLLYAPSLMKMWLYDNREAIPFDKLESFFGKNL